MNLTQIIRPGTIHEVPPMMTLADMLMLRTEFAANVVKQPRYATIQCKRCGDPHKKADVTQVGTSRGYVLCDTCLSATQEKRDRRKK